MISIVGKLIQQGLVTQSPLSALRVKVHVPCQWKCSFCHMEGNHKSSSIKNVDALMQVLLQFRKHFNFNEVHYTGGEPSLHPLIEELVRVAKSLGFIVKMTTNGQSSLQKYLDLAAAGLDEINFSIHTLNGKELGELMNPAQDAKWGRRCISNQLKTINGLQDTLKIKVNTCVGEDESQAIAIAKLAENLHVAWRPMNILENPVKSYRALGRLCRKLHAEPVEVQRSQGTSSFRVAMATENGFLFKVKMIRALKLDSMCEGCPVEKAQECYEYAYGPRLEAQGSELLVRNCVHRQGEPFVMSPERYFTHPLAQELRSILMTT